MGKSDTAVKIWLSDDRRFADLFNGTVFGGKQVVMPEDLEKLDRETDIIITDKRASTKGLQRHRDIVKQWKHGTFLAVLACEAQDKVHYAMPVRNMLHDSLTYTEQIRKTWQKHPGQHLTGEEYLSRFRKKDRIFPVITLVFYYDLKKWDGAMDLYDMFHFDDVSEEETEEINILRTYLPNYRINLIDAGNVENINRFHTDLQQIFGVLQYRGQKDELRNYMLNNSSYFSQVDLETYYALQAFLHSEKFVSLMMDSSEKSSPYFQ